MNSAIDLHMHSTASDGTDTTEELIRNLQESGIHTFALTDHDTIDGACEIEKMIPKTMTFYRGVEFSCITEYGKCHILGYQYAPDNEIFQEALRLGESLRKAKFEKRVRYLDEVHGIVFSEEEMQYLFAQKSVGKPHLARLLIRKGLAADMQKAMTDYLNGCKAGKDKIDAEIAVKAIRAAGGIPVWAHPLGGEGEKPIKKEAFEPLLHTLLEAGIQGLECYYSRYTMDQVQLLLDYAAQYGLLVSGGSDYHGTNKNIPLGTLNADGVCIGEALLTLSEMLRIKK